MTNSADTDQEPAFIEVGEGDGRRRLAVRARASSTGSAPGLFWLGGFNSDMRGTKALALDAFAAERGRACIRFDYSGHGESGGAFIDGTIGRWLEDNGFSVGIIAQPDWTDPDAFSVLGRPRLFMGITAGNMDSMVNHYTAV